MATPIYIMISETDTGVGRIIRTISKYRYNHCSLTFDPTFRTWYSFARYRQDAPFYSGFIQEPVERFLAKTGDAYVRIFRLELADDHAQRVQELFSYAGREDAGLIYNYFDILAATVGLSVPVAGAYTCLGFTCAVLGRDYRTIEELDEDLTDCLFYDGSLAQLAPDSGSRDDIYFRNLGKLRACRKTAKMFGRIAVRCATRRRGDLIQRIMNDNPV